MNTNLLSLRSSRSNRAFTLVEMLVSMVILAVILVLMTKIIDATGKTWASTTGKIEQFRDARQGFEAITRRLSQATLNTYLDYEFDATRSSVSRYVRQSDLRFISGPSEGAGGTVGLLPGTVDSVTHSVFFQAPLGQVQNTQNMHLKNLVNTSGYWVEYLSDESWRPEFLNATLHPPVKKRWRLMELMEPSENMSVYSYTSGTDGSGNARASTYTGKDWFQATLAMDPKTRPAHALADNVVGLIILPKLTSEDESATNGTDPGATTLIAPGYVYDSTATTSNAKTNPKNQLPPLVQVTMVAVDEATFNRCHPNQQDEPAFPAIGEGKDKYFGIKDKFTDPTKYVDDLNSFATVLALQRLEYRVFTTTVSIRAAKWSTEQKN